MARTSTESQLSKLNRQIAELQKKQKELLTKSNSKVLAQIVALARKNGITSAEIAEAMKSRAGKTAGTKSRKKPAGAGQKVPPKYRNPADPEQTWTGRGKSPLWVLELQKSGMLEKALIQPTP